MMNCGEETETTQVSSVIIGETREMNCELTGAVVGYRCTDDIDVKLSDGR